MPYPAARGGRTATSPAASGCECALDFGFCAELLDETFHGRLQLLLREVGANALGGFRNRHRTPLAALFAGGRTQVQARADFASQAWWKLLSNAALGGVCALAVRPNKAAAEPEARELVRASGQEAAAFAPALATA